jgi:hypothetical protein
MDTSAMMKQLEEPQSLQNIDMEKIKQLEEQYSSE